MPNDSSAEIKDFISSLPYTYEPTHKAKEIKDNYSRMEGKHVSIAGRALAVRKAGKLIFIDLLDESGKIQAYFEFKALGEQKFNAVKALNPGDMLGVEGTVFKTTPGEISIKVDKYTQLAKALRPLPDKWHGLKDTELRYRKRYLDLIMNPDVRDIFIKRSKMIRLIQNFLEGRGFVEFETPAIQPLYGGGDAEPFRTRVHTLSEDHYLRIANELYLKRLIIGGMERVYEIYKAFRNEDIDTFHSPEFTMIEWYQAYADYNDMMELTEEMFNYVAKELLGTTEITYQGEKVNLKAPFKRLKFVDSIEEATGKNILKLTDEELFQLAEKHGIKFEKGRRNRAHAYNKLLEVLVQPKCIQPTFLIDWPRITSPLTRPKRGNPELVERFELYVAGVFELANAYSELQNPIIQRENFQVEEKKAKAGDKEAEPTDIDFLEAMEYGMPPTGGEGIGIDRFLMLLTNKTSIKEVILFPMEKRERK
ncbi:MAG TPA: lysine--tRNA ligase [Dissulfurispiraceae bacterium]|nr:lysine--tRNA ligase [Dissulfurispiraceae bacterium]